VTVFSWLFVSTLVVELMIFVGGLTWRGRAFVPSTTDAAVWLGFAVSLAMSSVAASDVVSYRLGGLIGILALAALAIPGWIRQRGQKHELAEQPHPRLANADGTPSPWDVRGPG
jgi:hypothetical protein